jgi:hypothetical protein
MKFRALSKVVDSFKRHRLRDPTFWFDKVCIDQRDISAGLKVVPVYVHHCSQMLVLCGPTYAHRLWCAWELCALTSFVELSEALRRVELVVVHADDPTTEDEPAFNILVNFDVEKAHCYDPNEEARLRKVIDAVGTEMFNGKIRELSAALVKQDKRFGRNNLNGIDSDTGGSSRPSGCSNTFTSFRSSLNKMNKIRERSSSHSKNNLADMIGGACTMAASVSWKRARADTSSSSPTITYATSTQARKHANSDTSLASSLDPTQDTETMSPRDIALQVVQNGEEVVVDIDAFVTILDEMPLCERDDADARIPPWHTTAYNSSTLLAI